MKKRAWFFVIVTLLSLPISLMAEVLQGDYDGDKKTDYAFFDSLDGRWYIRSARGRYIAWAKSWGWAGAKAVRGDYDGDGRDDFAVINSQDSRWYVLSAKGKIIAWAQQWGWPGATPVPGDYDGDGLDDFAVFNAQDGRWYILSAKGTIIAWAQKWGWPGATPVPGDYDGDGRNDFAVFNSQDGCWYILSSKGTIIAWAQKWGWPGATPVSGDYDGDGRDDFAVFNPQDSRWYVLSTKGTIIAWAQQWGWRGATPVPGDYDGDGRNDFAVLETSRSYWYVRSANGTILTWEYQWGLPSSVINSRKFIIKNFAVNFARYDPATGYAGDFLFAPGIDKPLLEFGARVRDKNNAIKELPTFEYILRPDAEVRAIADGVIRRVLYQDDWKDYELLVYSTVDSNFHFMYDHLTSLRVSNGQTVKAGQVLGNPGTFYVKGFGRTEIMVDNVRDDVYYSPSLVLDPALAAEYQWKIGNLIRDWEAYKGNTSIYQESDFVCPGSRYLSMPLN